MPTWKAVSKGVGHLFDPLG